MPFDSYSDNYSYQAKYKWACNFEVRPVGKNRIGRKKAMYSPGNYADTCLVRTDYSFDLDKEPADKQESENGLGSFRKPVQVS